MVMVAGNAVVSKVAAERIAQAALDYANQEGYCDVVEQFLNHLGFPIPEQTVEVVITAKVKVPRGADEWDVKAYIRGLDFNEDGFEVITEDVTVSL